MNQSIETWDLPYLRGFQLQRVVSIRYAQAGQTVMVSQPCGVDFGHLYMSAMEEAVPPAMAASPTFTLSLRKPSPSHWAVLTDADFLAHLESQRAKLQEKEAKAREAAAQKEKEAKAKVEMRTRNRSASSGSGKAASSKADTKGPTTRTKTTSKAQGKLASSQGSRPGSSVG